MLPGFPETQKKNARLCPALQSPPRISFIGSEQERLINTIPGEQEREPLNEERQCHLNVE